jgi:hypothetical protein
VAGENRAVIDEQREVARPLVHLEMTLAGEKDVEQLGVVDGPSCRQIQQTMLDDI